LDPAAPEQRTGREASAPAIDDDKSRRDDRRPTGIDGRTVVVSFHCDVISCELARRGVRPRPGAAAESSARVLHSKAVGLTSIVDDKSRGDDGRGRSGPATYRPTRVRDGD